MDIFVSAAKEDLKTAAKRDFRQKQEAARKQRIFNPRIRIIGVDKQALDSQVEEKQKRLQCEREEQRNFEQIYEYQCKQLNDQLIALSKERIRIQKEINEFRCQNQRKEQSRDYDLVDPNYLRKLSPNQSQRFLGEDPTSLQRQRLQRAQQKSWLQQQILEQDRAKKDINEAERTFEAEVLARDARLVEIDQEERNLRRQMQMNDAQYNLQMAREQRAKQTQLKKEDNEDNLAEIINNLTSDILTENRDRATFASQFGPNRAIGTMYRGMSDEELRAIRAGQKQQIEERKLAAQKAKEMDAHFDEILQSTCDLIDADERQNRQLRQQIQTERNATNEQLAEEQKQRDEYLNAEVYKFKPTKEYFEQFNTTTR